MSSQKAQYLFTGIFIAVLLSLLLYRYIVYPAFVSPLSKIPNAHFTSPTLPAWIRLQHRNGGTGIRAIFAAHQKHGSIVRLSPDELSVASLDGLRKIYSGGFEKTQWYADEFMNYNSPNLVSLLGNKPHSLQKRMLSHVYSKSYIQNSIDLQVLSGVLLFERLFPILQAAAQDEKPLNMYSLNQALGLDFMSAYLFGISNSTDFIRNVSARDKYTEKWRTKTRDLPGKEKAVKELESYVLCLCIAAEAQISKKEMPTTVPSTQPIVYAQLSSKICDNSPLSEPKARSAVTAVASEMFDNLGAAHETARITLVYIQWELSRRPELQSVLRAELLTLSPPITYPTKSNTSIELSSLPYPQAVDKLPLLEAILKEILRLYPPSPALLPRITPTGGAIIDGYVIPPGTKVGTSAHCMHRNEEVFPEAGEFKPERWLEDGWVKGNEDRRKEMNKWFWAFGSGGRMCIGSHFAVHSKSIIKLVELHLHLDFFDETCWIVGVGCRD